MDRATNYIVNPQWDNDDKRSYRQECIIFPAKNIFGHSIPLAKQYWTLCGAHFNGDVALKGEFGQLDELDLILPHQFHGVDRESSIIKGNKKFYPEANWICGDFKEVMQEYALRGDFNPAIIHFDCVNSIKFAVPYVTRLFWFIDNNVPDSMMFVINLMLNNPYRIRKELHGRAFIDGLLKEYNCPDHWTFVNSYYRYKGTGSRSRSVLGTFIWVKEPHSKMVYSGKRLDVDN